MRSIAIVFAKSLTPSTVLTTLARPAKIAEGDEAVRLIGILIATGITFFLISGCGSDDAAPASGSGGNGPTATPPLASTAVQATSATDLNLDDELSTYRHPLGIWQISYPPAARISGPAWDADNSFEGVEFGIPYGDQNFFALGVTRLEVQEYRTSEEWSLSILEGTEKSSSSYELISWENYSVGGFLGYEAVFSRSGGAFDFVHLELHVVAGADTYRVVGVTDRTVWDDVRELLTTLVHSFTLRR